MAGLQPEARSLGASLRTLRPLRQTSPRTEGAHKPRRQRPCGILASAPAVANLNGALPTAATARHRIAHERAHPGAAGRLMPAPDPGATGVPGNPPARKGWRLPTPRWHSLPAVRRHTRPERWAGARAAGRAATLPCRPVAPMALAPGPGAALAVWHQVFSTSSCSLRSMRHGGPSGGPNASVCQPRSRRNPPLPEVGTT